MRSRNTGQHLHRKKCGTPFGKLLCHLGVAKRIGSANQSMPPGESVEILSVDSLEVRVARVFNASRGES